LPPRYGGPQYGAQVHIPSPLAQQPSMASSSAPDLLTDLSSLQAEVDRISGR
jgi:hypothetical protein